MFVSKYFLEFILETTKNAIKFKTKGIHFYAILIIFRQQH